MQENVWEKEYKNPKLVSLSDEPTTAVKDFVRFLRKDAGLELSNLKILDLGCGNAKNSKYIFDHGINNQVIGVDISDSAIQYAKDLLPEGVFFKKNIGQNLEFPDRSFDIILDATSSNSLTEKERSVYLNEVRRLLKDDRYFFLRALCKDGDKNAKNLLELSPGTEKDTYVMPEINLTERVFSKEDLINTYSPFFEIIFIKKETHYTKFNNNSYKRNFWVVYMKKVAK